MREIKFRAWDTKKNYFDYEPIVSQGRACYIDSFDSLEQYRDGRMILQQYTGLKDRNGKEIYEEERLRIEPYQDEHYEVVVEEIDNVPFCIRTPWSEEYDVIPLAWYFNRFGTHTVEIIGNIWENPQLLERSQS